MVTVSLCHSEIIIQLLIYNWYISHLHTAWYLDIVRYESTSITLHKLLKGTEYLNLRFYAWRSLIEKMFLNPKKSHSSMYTDFDYCTQRWHIVWSAMTSHALESDFMKNALILFLIFKKKRSFKLLWVQFPSSHMNKLFILQGICRVRLWKITSNVAS